MLHKLRKKKFHTFFLVSNTAATLNINVINGKMFRDLRLAASEDEYEVSTTELLVPKGQWQLHVTAHAPVFGVYSLFNPLNTKRRLLYLKTQFVPRSKHFISVIKTNNFML